MEREGLRDTPKRVAKALAFAMRGYDACPTAALGTALFHERGMERASCATTVEDVRCGTSDVVLVRDIPVFSTCAKTFMPFYGVIHVGYVPRAGVIVGLHAAQDTGRAATGAGGASRSDAGFCVGARGPGVLRYPGTQGGAA